SLCVTDISRVRYLPVCYCSPTRRSSDLAVWLQTAGNRCARVTNGRKGGVTVRQSVTGRSAASLRGAMSRTAERSPRLSVRSSHRSEEHKSELQSRENIVCRLLLEKKK